MGRKTCPFFPTVSAHQIKVTTLSGGFAAVIFTRSELSFCVFQPPQLLEPSFFLEVQSDLCH